MPLEDLTGADKYINAFNVNWPDGAIDFPDAGDDHISGIKNVLVNTFPNIDGPVTLDQDELNRGVIESSSRMVFYQAAAPTGWTRVTVGTDYMIRLIATTDGTGGTAAGSHNPILNNLVPSHNHVVSGSTGGENQNHTHAGTTAGENANHVHQYQILNTTGIAYEVGIYGATVISSAGNANSGIENVPHAHAFVTGIESVAHLHTFSATSQGNAGASNWAPRYANVILCQRD